MVVRVKGLVLDVLDVELTYLYHPQVSCTGQAGPQHSGRPVEAGDRRDTDQSLVDTEGFGD